MLKTSRKFLICAATIFLHQISYSITLVYNLRIRRAFDIPVTELLSEEKKSFLILSALPIIYTKNRKIIDEPRLINLTDKRRTIGSLFNARTVLFRRWWAELTTAVERERVKSHGTTNFTASRTALDDIVLAAGRNFFWGKNSQFIVYGLAGFPTTRKVTLKEAQDTLVGTRFFSAGIGSEFSHAFINSLKRSLVGIFQNRFLHFFSRKWTPILPENAKIQPGNVTDLLFAIRYRERKNTFETGYNLTFFTNQAVILPTRTIGSDNWGRHSFYASYSHIFAQLPPQKPPIIIGGGMLISRARRFETKIFSIWGNFTIVF